MWFTFTRISHIINKITASRVRRAAFERAKIMPKLDSHDLHQKKGLEAQSGV
jgi:hypothetical protein